MMNQIILFGLFVFFTIMSPVFTDDYCKCVTPVSTDDRQCGARKENAIRPCPQNNKTCVRAYFQSRSNCKADVAANDSLQSKELIDYLPNFNLTVDQSNATIGGLTSGKIVDFLVDYQTNLLVLTVNFANITIGGPSDFIYYQTAMEPRHTTTHTSELYPSVTITTIFYSATSPNVNNIFCVANVTETLVYSLGSCVTEATDPVLVNLFTSFRQNINVAIQESFQSRGKIIAIDYIQKNLCNYGVKQ